MQPHAGTDDFQKIHNAERPITLVGAQFAMIGMIDRDQRVDAGCFGRQKLLLLERATLLREDAQIVSLQPDRGLMQIDNFDTRHRAQNLFRRFDDVVHTGNDGAAQSHVYRLAGLASITAGPFRIGTSSPVADLACRRRRKEQALTSYFPPFSQATILTAFAYS
jgi:hypothetical protein